jgi:23S rRNA maturation mini-RNase III
MANLKEPDLTQRLRENAWIGDAVLELYVRSHIMLQEGRIDAEKKTRFTCNQFLSCHGNPTAVEAEIGVIYQRDGLEAAFAWIRDTLEPLFLKQEAKRARQGR